MKKKEDIPWNKTTKYLQDLAEAEMMFLAKLPKPDWFKPWNFYGFGIGFAVPGVPLTIWVSKVFIWHIVVGILSLGIGFFIQQYRIEQVHCIAVRNRYFRRKKRKISDMLVTSHDIGTFRGRFFWEIDCLHMKMLISNKLYGWLYWKIKKMRYTTRIENGHMILKDNITGEERKVGKLH